MSYHAIVHSQPGLSGFYEEQSTLLLESLRRAEESLSDYAMREGSSRRPRKSTGHRQSLRSRTTCSRNAIIVGTEERLRVVRDQLGAGRSGQAYSSSK
jgi:hypothetical protein